MTRDPAWKKHQVKRKWRSILSVFLTVTLFFAIANGFAKGFSLKNQFAKSKWDGKSSIAIAINTKNPAVFIYQPDPKKAVILTVGDSTLYETGNAEKPLEKIADAAANSGKGLTSALTHTFMAKIENYLSLQSQQTMDKDYSKKLFVNFASITTPLKLATIGWDDVKETNITRLDALKLWWQLKDTRADELKLADLSDKTQEIIAIKNQKVLGADTVSLNRIIANYLENLKVVSENKKIKIQNASKNPQAANLAASFASSVGANVVETSASDYDSSKTQVIAHDKKSYTAVYLAKIFNCDINGAQNLDNDSEITVIVGSDFATIYFE